MLYNVEQAAPFLRYSICTIHSIDYVISFKLMFTHAPILSSSFIHDIVSVTSSLLHREFCSLIHCYAYHALCHALRVRDIHTVYYVMHCECVIYTPCIISCTASAWYTHRAWSSFIVMQYRFFVEERQWYSKLAKQKLEHLTFKILPLEILYSDIYSSRYNSG